MQGDSDNDLIGNKLGSFVVLELIGEGAMAKVYRAHQPRLNREVALKVIRRVPGQRDDATRFEREKKVLERLTHPHIMPIHEYAGSSSYLWIASPLIAGGTLADLLHSGPMPMERVASVVGQLAEALDFAHEMQVVHRDLKPGNVLFEYREGCEHYYLADFGVAKLLEAEGLTMPGMTMGTPEYMSPEQVLGKRLDGRSDQYSLGILCYQLATGRVPFEGALTAVMTDHARTAPPIPSGVSPEVTRVVLRALAKEPSQRFGSCGEFAEALQIAVFGAPTPTSETLREPIVDEDLPLSSPPPGFGFYAQSSRRRPWRALVGLLGALLLAGGLRWGWLRAQADATPTPTPTLTTTPLPSPTRARPHPKPRRTHTPPRKK